MLSQHLLRVVSDREPQNGETDIRAKALEGTEQAMVILDNHGVVIGWNAAAEVLFGWSTSEAMGRHAVSLVPEGPPRDEVAEIFNRVQRGELLAGQLPAFRRNGDPIRRTATISPIRGDAGEVIGFLSVSVPLTSTEAPGVRMRRARVQCVACGREVAGTMRRKYCSEKCRQWAYYHRHVEAQRARSRERHERRRAARATDDASPNGSAQPSDVVTGA
jgi:PAS domain S-box-containing protein